MQWNLRSYVESKFCKFCNAIKRDLNFDMKKNENILINAHISVLKAEI